MYLTDALLLAKTTTQFTKTKWLPQHTIELSKEKNYHHTLENN